MYFCHPREGGDPASRTNKKRLVSGVRGKEKRGETVKTFLTACLLLTLTVPAQARERWTEAKANAWYAKQKWRVGANYIPANAINQLEMWQAASFDPATI